MTAPGFRAWYVMGRALSGDVCRIACVTLPHYWTKDEVLRYVRANGYPNATELQTDHAIIGTY